MYACLLIGSPPLGFLWSVEAVAYKNGGTFKNWLPNDFALKAPEADIAARLAVEFCLMDNYTSHVRLRVSMCGFNRLFAR
jgi:hypothetical protein